MLLRGIFYAPARAAAGRSCRRTAARKDSNGSFDSRLRVEISANISKFLVNIFACNLLRIV
ncbi:hypothetical protein A8H35_27990 [Burkholderia thailandensis]|nr:hypothetical protein A8H35_27990 [Burkholderia thailandensis]AWY63932.1 hypothetical protein A8H36_00190 [Burkholderia thailandensis]PHH34507.1 hypothetical protein CRX59_28450 [Burkholderia thailandensis]